MAASPQTLMHRWSGPGELGAHGEAEAVAELGGLAPADVGERRGRLPEGRHLIARAAGVVRDDGPFLVDQAVQLGDHPVRVDRRGVVRPAWAPIRPARPRAARAICDRDVLPGCRRSDLSRPSIAWLSAVRVSRASPIRRVLRRHVLVQVHRVEGRVDDRLARLACRTPKPVSAKLQPTPRMTSASARKRLTGPGVRPPAAAERQRVILGEGALALDRGGDRDVPGLGQGLQLGPGLARSARPGPRRSPGARAAASTRGRLAPRQPGRARSWR